MRDRLLWLASRLITPQAAGAVLSCAVAAYLYRTLRRSSRDPPSPLEPLDECAARQLWPVCLLSGQLSFQTLVNERGLRIATYAIVHERPVGAVILVHGFRVSARFEFIRPSAPGEAHSCWEGSQLEELHRRGLSLYLLDQEGHGQSDSVHGVRAHIESIDDLARDVLQFARETVIPDLEGSCQRQGVEHLPLFLYGQSLGAAVVLRVSQLTDNGRVSGWPLSGIVCGSPFVSLPSLPPWPVLALVKLLAALVPTRASIMASGPNGIDHLAYARELATEPTHYHSNPTWGLVQELLRTSAEFMGSGHDRSTLESVHTEAMLVVCSYADTLVSWRGAVALFERARLPRRKTLVMIRGCNRDATAKPGEARSMVDGVVMPPDDRLWSADLLNLPLWHNMTREPHGEMLASAIAEWVLRECHAQKATMRS